jgi:hypothetical protein
MAMTKTTVLAWMLAGTMAFGVGCGDDDDDKKGENASGSGSASEIEIAGTWAGEFDDTEVIDSDTWEFSYASAEIVDFDNSKNVAITKNPADAEYDPGKYNKIVWTEPKDGEFYYCTVDFGLDSVAEAKASEAEADETDLDEIGCGGFAWSKLSEQSGD